MTDAGRMRLSKRPQTIRKLNDSVYELHNPNATPEMDVIFFHGLQRSNYQDADWNTWLSRDGTVVWPQKWLGESFPESRVLSISYDAAAVQGYDSGRTDPYIISENLIHDIILNPTCGAGQNRPIVLVGHCLGGIIVKMLILDCLKRKGQTKPETDAHRRMDAFLNNLKGVFYYAPPQNGAYVKDYLPTGGRFKQNEEILALLTLLGERTARINNDFNNVKQKLDISTEGMFEGRATGVQGGEGRMVVEEASARSVGVEIWSTATRADHIDVCKPEDRHDNIFTALVNFIKRVGPDGLR